MGRLRGCPFLTCHTLSPPPQRGVGQHVGQHTDTTGAPNAKRFPAVFQIIRAFQGMFPNPPPKTPINFQIHHFVKVPETDLKRPQFSQRCHLPKTLIHKTVGCHKKRNANTQKKWKKIGQ